jgi:hypothetical protein
VQKTAYAWTAPALYDLGPLAELLEQDTDEATTTDAGSPGDRFDVQHARQLDTYLRGHFLRLQEWAGRD